MVLNQIDNEQDKKEEKKSESKFTKKIYTCTEIEQANQVTMNNVKPKPSNYFNNNLKHDSAVLASSTKNDHLTRYDKADLLALRNGRLSQEPPRCFYNPNIMRLNILKYGRNVTETIENEMKNFKDKLQNLMLSSWDPSVLHLLKQYHNLLLDPNPMGNAQRQILPQQTNIDYSMTPSQPQASIQQQLQRNLFHQQSSPMQQQHQHRNVPFTSFNSHNTILDRIPSYDRNVNFFDNITTTTLRPPVAPRFANSSYAYKHQNQGYNHPQQKRFFNNNNINKQSSPIHERNICNSSGYFSGNDTRSTMHEDTLIDKAKASQQAIVMKNSGQPYDNNNNNNIITTDESNEPEPEWLNVPVTRFDYVDLHGFEDDENANKNDNEAKISPKNIDRQMRENQQTQSHAIRSTPNNNNNSYRRNNNNQGNHLNRSNSNGYNFNPRTRDMNHSYQNQHQPANANNFNHRFRNPLHFHAKPPQFNQAQVPMNRNFPSCHNSNNLFFEAWKSGKMLNEKNLNFAQLIDHSNASYAPPPTIKQLSDVEQAIIDNKYNPTENVPAPNIPQFFENLAQNWGIHLNNQQHRRLPPPPPPPQQQYPPFVGTFDGITLPTHEQLQQHTSEIMKNAMLRKQRDRQYHDEN